MNRPSWHEYFMMLAKLVSVRSTCHSRKNRRNYRAEQPNTCDRLQRSGPCAPHCIDRGPDFCLRRSIGAHDADKYNYCLSSHAESTP